MPSSCQNSRKAFQYQSNTNKKNLVQESDTSVLENWVKEVIENNPEQVAQYKAGKQKVFGFFVGQIMKMSKGKADPGVVNGLLKEKLDS